MGCGYPGDHASKTTEMAVRKTLTGAIALLGEDATPSPGPVDIVIDGRLIQDIRPSGTKAPEGTVIDMTDRLLTAGLINGHHHSHEGYYKGRKDNMPLELWMNYVRPLKPLPRRVRRQHGQAIACLVEPAARGKQLDAQRTEPQRVWQ